MADLTINSIADGTGVRVTLAGDADAFHADMLDAEFDRLSAAAPTRIAVDLSGVTFMSSAGMGAFVKLRSVIGKSGGELVLGGARPEIAESFRRARLDRFLKFVESV